MSKFVLFINYSASLLSRVSVVVGVTANLDKPSSGEPLQVVEDRIVSSYASVLRGKLENRLADIKRIFRDNGFDVDVAILTQKHSIGAYFTCESVDQIRQLRNHFKTGNLKKVLEEMFTLLSESTERVGIKNLVWSQDDFQRCEKHLTDLPGWLIDALLLK